MRAPRLQGAFGGALVALSAAAGLVVGIRSVAVVQLPGGVHGLLRLPPAPHEGMGIAWSSLAKWPAQLQDAALDRLCTVVVILALAAVSVALLNTLVLLLEAGSSRRREVAVRAALGAPPAHLVRLFLADVRRLLALAFPLGLLLGLSAGGVMRATWPGGVAPLHLADGAGTVALGLLASAGVAALAYVWVGLTQGRTRALAGELGAGERSTDDPATVFRRRILSALQMGVAGSVALAAASLTKAVRVPSAAEEGVATTVVSVTAPALPAGGGAVTDGRRAADAWQPLLEKLATVPGLKAESLSTPGALVGLGVRDYATGQCGACVRYLPTPFLNAQADHFAVSAGYFDLTGGRVLQGRGFTTADGPAAEKVAVVNESFVRAVFDHGALGHLMRLGRDLDTWYTVVGVVADEAPAVVGHDDVPRPQVYVSALQVPPARADVLLRGSEEGVQAALSMLSAQGYRPGEPRVLAEVRRAAAKPLVWVGDVALVLGLVTLLLAVQGSHATALQITRRRFRELAVRRVLGATDARILLLVLLGAARGAVWGSAVAVFLGSLWVALLQKTAAGVPSPGLGAYVVVAVLLVGASVLASMNAAREALAVQPAAVVA